MKKSIALFLLLCLTMNAFALSFLVDGIYYTVTSSTEPFTVAVSSSNGAKTGHIIIPTTVTNGSIIYTVSSIGDNAFSYKWSMSGITLPSTIKTIGNSTFLYCNKLPSITIPEFVTSIGSNAFDYCEILNSITLPNALTSIEDFTFSHCYALTSITIPKNVGSIKISAFANCPKLQEVNIEQGNTSFKSIDGVLFNAERSTLLLFPYVNSTKYVIPEGVTTIGDKAFNNCLGLSSVSLPSGLIQIGNDAFSNCIALRSLTIPSSVTTIGDYAFSGCTGVNTLTMPGGFSSIGINVFYNTPNIYTLFSGGTIEAKELLYYSNISALHILEGTKSIDYSAFSGFTSLKTISIPGSVTYIGVFAFGMCTKLENIHCEITSPLKINSNTFFAINVDACKLYIPIGSSDTYKNAATWGDFAYIIEEMPISINKTRQSNINVYNDRNSLSIIGGLQGEKIYIYNNSGSLVKSLIMDGNEMRLNLPPNILYLVKTKEKTFKVVL